MNPFKIGDRVEQKDNYGNYVTKKGWQGTITEINGPYLEVRWDEYKICQLTVKNNEVYLLQADGEKSVKEDASKDTHKEEKDNGWGF